MRPWCKREKRWTWPCDRGICIVASCSNYDPHLVQKRACQLAHPRILRVLNEVPQLWSPGGVNTWHERYPRGGEFPPLHNKSNPCVSRNSQFVRSERLLVQPLTTTCHIGQFYLSHGDGHLLWICHIISTLHPVLQQQVQCGTEHGLLWMWKWML